MGIVRDWFEGRLIDVMLPVGVCPVLGHCAYGWHDALGDVALRQEFIWGSGLDVLLEGSANALDEERRKRLLLLWVQRIAWPAWLAYSQVGPDEDLSDVFAESMMENRGNGNERILSELRMSGVTPALLAAQGVILGLTKDRAAMRARALVTFPKTLATFRGGATAAVSPFELSKWCFEACFIQPANPIPTRELLQESIYMLLRVTLDPTWAPVEPFFATGFAKVQAVVTEAGVA